MIDTIAVGLIVAAAVAYIVYRYVIKKSGGCTCGCGGNGKSSQPGCCCGGVDSSRSCDCRK